MNKISEMIEELCPEGVEWRKLGEVCEVIRGKGLSKSDKGTGNKPIILYGELYTTYGNYINDVVSKSSAEAIVNCPTIHKSDILLPISSTTKEALIGKASAYCCDYNAYLGGDALLLRHHEKAGYLVHLLNCTWFEDKKMSCVQGTTINHLNPNKLKDLLIPLPPLAVQQAIVGILDKFDALNVQLEALLEAEKTAREKQYAYYRDKLLTFDSGVEWRKLGEVCEVKRGRVISKKDIREKVGIYPVYSSQTENNGELGRISSYDIDGEYVTWTTDGANAGSVFYRNGKFSITNVCGLLKPITTDLNTKFLYYVLTVVAKSYVSAGMGNPKLMSNVMSSILIPLPPLAEQERIVAILDKFDALTHDLTHGLPAEIETREKQYAYYRDKLLTFEQK